MSGDVILSHEDGATQAGLFPVTDPGLRPDSQGDIHLVNVAAVFRRDLEHHDLARPG